MPVAVRFSGTRASRSLNSSPSLRVIQSSTPPTAESMNRLASGATPLSRPPSRIRERDVAATGKLSPCAPRWSRGSVDPTMGGVDFRAPPPLERGSLIAIVAPAGPFDRDVLFPGLAWLRTRYRLRLSTRILMREGY